MHMQRKITKSLNVGVLLTTLSYWIFEISCPGITLSLCELTMVMVTTPGVFALSKYDIAVKDAIGFKMVNQFAQIFRVICIGLISALITSVNILHLSQNGSAANLQPRLEGE